MQPCVFIHTNDRQMVGAIVSAHSLRRNSRRPDDFEVRILNHRDYPFLAAREGQLFLRDGFKRAWHNDDLQSFTPLRFLPPQEMGYAGRAVVIDPDIFAVGDITELLFRDMQGKAILCRYRPAQNGKYGYLATSVMLLDCEKLRHWRVEEDFGRLFSFERDYARWVNLEYEPRETIGLFEDEWNHFDTLTPETRLLHNTKRNTQPWKTGLPVDYTVSERKLAEKRGLGAWAKRVFGSNEVHRYKPHPDPRQEQLFFGLLRECVEKGIVTEDFLREEMRQNHIRHDSLQLIERTPALAA